MPLTEVQAENVKKQILKQIETFPDLQQRQSAKEQVQAMNPEQLENLIIQNKLIKQPEIEESECIFCNIIENKIPSNKIDENKSSIAILDINPISKGHSLIIPKQHSTIEKLPSSILSLAKKIAKKLKSKLKPKPEEVKIETSSIQGHALISIIPLYKDTKLERKKAKPEDLIALQQKLQSKKREPRKKKKPIKLRDLSFAPVRIP